MYFEWLGGVVFYEPQFEGRTHAHTTSTSFIGSWTRPSNVGGVRGSSSSESAEATELSNTNNLLKHYPGGTKTLVLLSFWRQKQYKQTLESLGQPGLWALMSSRRKTWSFVATLAPVLGSSFVDKLASESASGSHWASCATNFAVFAVCCSFFR